MKPRFIDYDEVIGDKHYNLIINEMAHAKLSVVSEFIRNANTERIIFTRSSS